MTEKKLRLKRRSLFAAAAGVPFLNIGQHRLFAATTRTYSTRCLDLVKRSLVIDMLAPIVLTDDLTIVAKPISDSMRTDYKRSGVTAIHNSVGIEGPTAPEEVADYIATWSGFCGRNGHVFSLVGVAADIDKAKHDGKVAVVMGVQNSDHFRRVEDVKKFYLMGQRVSQLTYNYQNLIAAGCLEPVDPGVSEFGQSIVKAMNDQGMLVDVSHCGDKTTLDAIAMSTKPIAITHANCRSISGHRRAKTDEAIRALAARGGVIGISAVRVFVSATEPTTIENLIDHVDLAAKLAGIEHVGIGSDMDLYGYDNLSAEDSKKLQDYYKGKYGFRAKLDTDDTSHPQRIYDITEGLIRRGYSDRDIAAVLGGNFRRLLGEVWG